MLTYLVILLDDSSVSYCHYDNVAESNIMPLKTLQDGILFAMKNNLQIQYVLPKYTLPESYVDAINSMFHDNIGPIDTQEDIADVVIIDGIDELLKNNPLLKTGKKYVLRTTFSDFIERFMYFKEVLEHNINVNVVFKDVESFTDDKIELYQPVLNELATSLKTLFLNGGNTNTNIITDRIALSEMNNCGAGDTSITLAPNGKFYPCPAFYYAKDRYSECGDLEKGLAVKNQKLYKLEGSPLCRRCDAYHCKRCVWLNKKLTCEINIPSRQQCILAHTERAASKELLKEFHKLSMLVDKEIKDIEYIDPFDEFQSI